MKGDYVNLDDLHAAASVMDRSQAAVEMGVTEGDLLQFATDLEHVIVKAPGDRGKSMLAYGVCVGIMAERHRIHREEHVVRQVG